MLLSPTAFAPEAFLRMLTIEECRHVLNDPSATDEEIERLRDELYRFVNRFLDGHFSEANKYDQ